jgi:hypothetical protein
MNEAPSARCFCFTLRAAPSTARLEDVMDAIASWVIVAAIPTIVWLMWRGRQAR